MGAMAILAESERVLPPSGHGSKLSHQKTAGFTPCFHFSGLIWDTHHTHLPGVTSVYPMFGPTPMFGCIQGTDF